MTKGATPRHQVRPERPRGRPTSSASSPQGDCGPARAASRRQTCLPRPWNRRREPTTRDPRRCEGLDQLPPAPPSCDVGTERPCSPGVSCLLGTSRLDEARHPGLLDTRCDPRTVHRRGERLVSEGPTLLRVDRDSRAPLRGPPRRLRVGFVRSGSSSRAISQPRSRQWRVVAGTSCSVVRWPLPHLS
jgi:hypothetical protein